MSTAPCHGGAVNLLFADKRSMVAHGARAPSTTMDRAQSTMADYDVLFDADGIRRAVVRAPVVHGSAVTTRPNCRLRGCMLMVSRSAMRLPDSTSRASDSSLRAARQWRQRPIVLACPHAGPCLP